MSSALMTSTCRQHHRSRRNFAVMTASVQSRPRAAQVIGYHCRRSIAQVGAGGGAGSHLGVGSGGQRLRCHPRPCQQPQDHHMTVKNIRNHLPKVRWVMEMSSSWMLKSFARCVSCLRTSSDTCERVAGQATCVPSGAPQRPDQMAIKAIRCPIKGITCASMGIT